MNKQGATKKTFIILNFLFAEENKTLAKFRLFLNKSGVQTNIQEKTCCSIFFRCFSLCFDGRQFFEVFRTNVDVIYISDIILMSDTTLFSK